MNKTRAQVIRLAIWAPVALFLIALNSLTDGWHSTLQVVSRLAINIVVAVTVAKLAKLM